MQGDLQHGSFDPARYIPRRIEGARSFDRGPDPEAPFALATESGDSMLFLSAAEMELLDTFDGEKTVDDICADLLEKHRSLALPQVYSLIRRLWQADLLIDDPGFGRGLGPAGSTGLSISIPGTALLSRGLAAVLRPLKIASAPGFAVTALLAIAGLLTVPEWLLSFASVPQTPYVLPGIGVIPATYPATLFVLLIMNFLCSAVREWVVAGVEGVYTGRFSDLRFGFFHGIPCFRHDRRWRPILPTRGRVATGVAGISTELILAGICVCLVNFGIMDSGREWLGKLAFVLYARAFFHLSPFAASDLHGILADWSTITDFRRKALGFLHHQFIDTILGRLDMTRRHCFLLAYTLISLMWFCTFTHFGVLLLQRNPKLVSSLILTGPDQRGVVLVLLSLFLIPILLSCLISIAYAGYIVWRYLNRLPLLQTPNRMMLCFVFVLVLVSLVVLCMPEDMQSVALTSASATMVLAAAGLVVRTYQERMGMMGLMLRLIGVALTVCGVRLVMGSLGLHAEHLYILDLMAFLLLLAPLLVAPWHRQIPLLSKPASTTAPSVTFFAGLLLFCLVSVVAVSSPAALDGIGALTFQHVELVGLILVLISATALRGHLASLPEPSPLVTPDNADDTAATLRQCGSAICRRIGDGIAETFGTALANAVERRVAKKIGRTFSFDAPLEEPVDNIADLIRREIVHIDESLASWFGQACATRLMTASLHRLNYECYLLFYREVLTGTRFAHPISEDGSLDAARCEAMLADVSLFASLKADDRRVLARQMTVHQYPANELIARAGDPADTCHLLLHGDVQVEHVDISGDVSIVAVMHAGDFFGEAALRDGGHRMADVRTVTPTTALVLAREDFAQLSENSEMVEEVTERVNVLQVLFSIRLFADLPSMLLGSMLSRFTTDHFHDGQMVFHKGDHGEDFYVIQSGKVNIIEDGPSAEERVVRELGVNDYFGEIALIKGVPRTMTARAVGETTTLKLDRQAILQLVEASKLFGTNIAAVGEQRMQRA